MNFSYEIFQSIFWKNSILIPASSSSPSPAKHTYNTQLQVSLFDKCLKKEEKKGIGPIFKWL
jgi:hypothetical protein